MSDYLKTYKENGIYNKLHYGAPYVSKGVKFARYLTYQFKKGSKILCVGCGNGWEVVALLKAGFDAYGTEVHEIDVPILKNRIINAIAPDLPFKDDEFDLMMCCEVLEHVPEDKTDDIINDCARVGKKSFFSIATKPDPPWNTHINLHKPQWWLDKFFELKLKIHNFQFKPMLDLTVDHGEGTISLKRLNYSQGMYFYVSKGI